MPEIELQTEINARTEIVFDLARSIDLHLISAKSTNEKAIGGVTSGLIGIDEFVVWRAKHFGVYQNFTSKITEFNRSNFFIDEMVTGAFKKFRHEHHFTRMENVTVMRDYIDYVSPLGFLGNIADRVFLKRYLIDFLTKRNNDIKEFAESEKGSMILNRK